MEINTRKKFSSLRDNLEIFVMKRRGFLVMVDKGQKMNLSRTVGISFKRGDERSHFKNDFSNMS